MDRFPLVRWPYVVAVLALVALLAAGCDSPAATTTTTSTTTTAPAEEPGTTQTEPPDAPSTTPGPPEEVPGTSSESLDPTVVEEMRSETAELIAEAEVVRGLPFLATPSVTILDEADFEQRVTDLVAEELDPAEIEREGRFLTMLGMLDAGTDLRRLFIDLYGDQVAGFYDGDARELVVPASTDGFTALQKVTVVHELVHALTDQHFEFNDEWNRLFDEGVGDDAAAFQGLVEGDASRAQFVYMQSLSPEEAMAAATEVFGYDTSVLDAAPDWLQADLLFPYDQGLTFVDGILATGGLAAVDQAYQDPPRTTEQILDPDKYLRGEGPVPLDSPAVDLPGWELHDEATFGEWGLRLIFGTALSPGEATQAAAGWGNDAYRVFDNGTDVAVALHYVGDAERDAEEVADGLIALARGPMSAGPPVEAGGGLLFDQGTTYVFIDRVDDEVYFVASTSPSAGSDLRNQLGL